MVSRRQLLATAATGTAVAVTAWATGRERDKFESSAGDGLRPIADETTGAELLRLPEGFRYRSYSWSLDPTDDGHVVSGLHDGMGAFPRADGRTVSLVRNHEITVAPLLAPSPAYDPKCGGGTTNLEFDLVTGEWRSCKVSLAGTYRNCAGGPTAWGSWLTCEETLIDASTGPVERTHGWVFEVPVHGVADAKPLVGLGRFQHEAAVTDPSTGIVYLTEDEGRSGLYRFVPGDPRGGAASLRAPGQLQMLAVDGDHRRQAATGDAVPVGWVDIDDPETAEGKSVFDQGHARGGMTFKRLEGCWLDEGRLYFVATTGGAADMGQVWELNIADDRLTLLYESPGRDVLDQPDNLISLPGHGLLICEDGAAPNRMKLLTEAGDIVPFAENAIMLDGLKKFRGDYRRGEWAGVCRSGDWLFANIQVPGITFAITGPWDSLTA